MLIGDYSVTRVTSTQYSLHKGTTCSKLRFMCLAGHLTAPLRLRQRRPLIGLVLGRINEIRCTDVAIGVTSPVICGY